MLARAARLTRRQRVALAATVVVTIAAAAFGWWFVVPEVRTTTGPLDTPGVDGTGFAMEVGDTGHWGRTIVINEGDKDATIESIRALDVPDGLEILQTLIAGPNRKRLYMASSRVWPDPYLSDLRPAAGATVAPVDTPEGERGAEIVLVVRATKPGRHILSRLEITYRVGRHKHRRVVRGVLALCGSTVPWRQAPYCDTPEDLPE